MAYGHTFGFDYDEWQNLIGASSTIPATYGRATGEIDWMGHKKKGGRNPNRDIPFRGGTGTGASFLSSMGQGWEGVTGGSDWENRGPQLQKSFLLSEMGPGGYLSSGQQSIETAGRINSLIDQGRGAYDSTMNSLGSSGLSPRYARPIADQMRQQSGYQANEALLAGMGESNQRRFQAMLAYVNAASEAAWSQKMAAKNYKIAKSGQKLGLQGAYVGAGGEVVGGAVKGIAGLFG